MIRRRVFLQSQDDSIVEDNVGIGSGMDHPFDEFFVGVAITILSKDRSPSSTLGNKLLGPNKLLFEVHMSIANSESYRQENLFHRHTVNLSVAIDEDVIAKLGSILRIWHDLFVSITPTQ